MNITQLQPSKPRVHIGELRQVQAQHLPDFARRFACPTQLKREAASIKAKHPHLAEEVDHLVACELQRRSLAHLQLV